MTIQIIDGFDMYNGTGANTGIQAKYSFSGSIARWSLVAGRFGGQALRTTTITSGSDYLQRPLPSALGSPCGSFAMRVTTFQTATGASLHFGFQSGATPQFGIRVTSLGAIEVSRYSSWTTPAMTSLGISANGVIVVNTWHFIEITSTISGTVGAVTVKVDGTAVLTLTSINNKNASAATADGYVVGASGSGGTGGTFDIDDLYFTDGASLGERRIETLYPSADTAQKDFTPNSGVTNFSRVNEAQVDGDTSYVQASTVGNTDRYDFTDLTGSPATIDAVQISAFAEKTDATARSIALQVKSGATTSDGSNFALTASYAKLERLLTTDPNGGGAWSAAAVNALQVGPKVTV